MGTVPVRPVATRVWGITHASLWNCKGILTRKEVSEPRGPALVCLPDFD